jgi:hypothetical protein
LQQTCHENFRENPGQLAAETGKADSNSGKKFRHVGYLRVRESLRRDLEGDKAMNPTGTPGAERPDNPMKVLDRRDLSTDEKIAFLKDWQLDLTERMTATDENMRATQDHGRLAEQLRHVSRALGILVDSREEESPRR